MNIRNLAGLWLAITVLVLSACVPATLTPPVSPQTPTTDPDSPPASSGELPGTSWLLGSFGPADAPEPVLAGPPITLEFKPDGQAGGSGGCNSYGGAYQAQDGALAFGNLVSTERACADNALTQQEQRYYAALTAAGRYEVTADGLTIWYDDERGVLSFVPAPDAPAGPDSAQATE